MLEYLTFGLLVLIIFLIIILILLLKKNTHVFGEAKSEISRIENVIRFEQAGMRKEHAETLATNRREFDNKLSVLEQKISQKLHETKEEQNSRIAEMSRTSSENFNRLNTTVEERLEKVRLIVDTKLTDIQKDNGEKLEAMRRTVDEKLHKALEEKLGESFKSVSERLEQVHKGLGEMQSLAQGVGDLKKVLTNVKTRGSFGEIQLENILEQLLTPEQYEKNIATNPQSGERVEFALKLPGKDSDGTVYMPIDSKFPTESYDRLQDAYENGDAEGLATAGKEMEQFIKKSAKDIKDKYISPPHTTDFALLFLPTEGLYAEVLRRPGLVMNIQRDYHIVITGPTTLSALLNSLQMGFRTLAIEKRSSEVWKILGAVKTEFGKFGETLEKTQRRILSVNDDIEELIGVRTRQIISKLRTVESLPELDATEKLLDDGNK